MPIAGERTFYQTGRSSCFAEFELDVTLGDGPGQTPIERAADAEVTQGDWYLPSVRVGVAGDSSQTALRTFQRAMEPVFNADRRPTEWADARLQFIRGRRLRDIIGRALRTVADGEISVPMDLAEWLTWADIREVDGQIVFSEAAVEDRRRH